MKANNGSGNNESRDEWETPNWLFKELHKQYHFELDCCASEKNRKVSLYSNNFEEMKKEWIKAIAWMNPPFSKAKIMFKHFFKVVNKGVAIYRADNFETKIWQEIIFKYATWVFIPKGRISYHLATDNAMGRNGSRFPSALIGLNVEPPKGIKGTLLTTPKEQGGKHK